ncbi:MAG: XisI protein [Okeania sp. SIO3C4]|nr:XisI protein [Okeania sp. SIO3B3]NER07075.1 XisI protein [Okeania sp. SIO3C4]
MDKVDKYGETIQKVIQEYAGDRYRRKDVDRELIFDTKNYHYQIVNVVWEGDRRVYGSVLHLDIKGEKIWLQYKYNGTEIDFAEELVKAGVPHQDIVIGFHSPFMRRFTEYAVS